MDFLTRLNCCSWFDEEVVEWENEDDKYEKLLDNESNPPTLNQMNSRPVEVKE